MRGSKAKAIRRAMRRDIENGSSYAWIAHPKPFINVAGERVLRYAFQYYKTGGLRLYDVGKQIYTKAGILPRSDNG